MYLQLFVYLQVLDFLTTLVGMRLGLGEASPFIRTLMTAGPVAGLAVSKGIAFLIGGLCIWLNRQHIIRWINYWYAGLIVWNLSLLLIVRTAVQ